MTSSNHFLLVSDDEHKRNRTTSVSSLDSWEGIGLEDEHLSVSRPHSSRARTLANQKVKVTARSEPSSTAIVPMECERNAFMPRNVQSHKYTPQNVQQGFKHCDENHAKYASHLRNTPTDEVIWYTKNFTPQKSTVLKTNVQSSKAARTLVPAAHLFKADRVNRTRTGTDPKSSKDSTANLHLQQPQQVPSLDHTEKLKFKLLSTWNNFKYGLSSKTKSSFSLSPIHFLGVTYEEQHSGESSYEKFLLDFSSRVWLTYRRDFPTLENSLLTTDCGWGCMLRSGQMMLAQALVTHFLGRNWRIKGVTPSAKSDVLHRMILRWFGDLPYDSCPFSIHFLVSFGKSMGKKAGDWYGPASVAYILKQAMEAAAVHNPCLDDLCVYVAQDCTVYKKDVLELCMQPSRIQKFQDINVIRNSPLPAPHRKKLPVALNHYSETVIEWKEALLDDPLKDFDQSPVRNAYKFFPRGDIQSPPKSPLFRTFSNPFLATTSERSSPLPTMGQSSFPTGSSQDSIDEHRDRWRSLVVLVPVRLGGERLNKLYFPCIFKLLAHECSIGIIGGRPRHSLYFVGFQDDKLINLDPHYCQEVVDVTEKQFATDSFRCTDPRKIPISKMDPSCTIGFYFRTREDFDKFTENVEHLLSSDDGKSDYPVFIVSDGSSSTSFHNPSGFDTNIDEQLYENNSDLDGDDFVLI